MPRRKRDKTPKGGRKPQKKKDLSTVLSKCDWRISDGGIPFILKSDGRYDNLSGLFVGQIFDLRTEGEVLHANFTWRELSGLMEIMFSRDENSFHATYQEKKGERGEWRGMALDCIEKKVAFTLGGSDEFEGYFHCYTEAQMALKPVSKNVSRKRKRSESGTVHRPRKRARKENWRPILKNQQGTTEDRKFISGRLVDVEMENGSWVCMRPVYYRGNDRYVCLLQDRSWDLVEVHGDNMRGVLSPTFTWVGHELRLQNGDIATVYKVHTKLRYIRAKTKSDKMVELMIDYDRLNPSKSFANVLKEQRKQFESRGKSCKSHSNRIDKRHSMEYDPTYINTPLDAGCVKFTYELQQETMDHSGVVFVDPSEFSERFTSHPQLTSINRRTELQWVANPPLEFFEKWWMKIQNKAFNSRPLVQRGPGSLWHREFADSPDGETLVGFRTIEDDQFSRTTVHCIFAHWARVKHGIYYHDTLANATEKNIDMHYSIGVKEVIGLQQKFPGAGTECMEIVTPRRAAAHGCHKMALHSVDWHLVSFYEQFGYVTKWGLVFEGVCTPAEIEAEEALWDDDPTTNHFNNIYMARLV